MGTLVLGGASFDIHCPVELPAGLSLGPARSPHGHVPQVPWVERYCARARPQFAIVRLDKRLKWPLDRRRNGIISDQLKTRHKAHRVFVAAPPGEACRALCFFFSLPRGVMTPEKSQAIAWRLRFGSLVPAEFLICASGVCVSGSLMQITPAAFCA